MNRDRKAGGTLRGYVAANLKSRRLRLGLSQEQLADLAGLHRTYIGSVERSERNITLSTLETLSLALDARPEDLLMAPEHG